MEGNHLNRLSRESRISILKFFKTSSQPVFRLQTQLRRAYSPFNTCHQMVYSNLPFTYSRDSILSNHVIRQALEGYLDTRFKGLLQPPVGSSLGLHLMRKIVQFSSPRQSLTKSYLYSVSCKRVIRSLANT